MIINLLIILVYFHNAHSLNCIANSSFKILRSELISSGHRFTLQQINNKPIHSSAQKNVCHVTIFIDYKQLDGDVIIDFGRDTNRTANYYNVETWFPLVKGNDSIISYIELVCSWNELCDRIFVEKWIHWLTYINHKTLEYIFTTFLTSNIRSDKCYVENELTQCSSGMCVASYNAKINNGGLTTDCIHNISTATAGLYMKTESIELQPMDYKELSYICTSDGCNGIVVFNFIWKNTAILFDHIDPITDWLHLRIQIRESLNRMHEITEKIRDSSNSSAPKHIGYWLPGVVSICTTFLLWLAYVCCCGLCSKNQEGYTETPTSV